jgi:hypothetical protein
VSDRLPSWIYAPIDRAKKDALIDLAKQSGGLPAEARVTCDSLRLLIRNRQVIARNEAAAASQAKASEVIKDAAKAGLRPTGGTYRALKSARVMITADEANAALRALPPLPAYDEEKNNVG